MVNPRGDDAFLSLVRCGRPQARASGVAEAGRARAPHHGSSHGGVGERGGDGTGRDSYHASGGKAAVKVWPDLADLDVNSLQITRNAS